jgi:hypothetical protein
MAGTEADRDPADALIVPLPLVAPAVKTPLRLIVPSPLGEIDQTTSLPGMALPSWSLTTAVSCWIWPVYREIVDGERTIAVGTGRY